MKPTAVRLVLLPKLIMLVVIETFWCGVCGSLVLCKNSIHMMFCTSGFLLVSSVNQQLLLAQNQPWVHFQRIRPDLTHENSDSTRIGHYWDNNL